MSNYTLSDLKDEVLRRIKPSKEDEAKIKSHLSPILERIKDMEFQIQGSFAKGTWLRGSSDVDVFIFFDKDMKGRMEEIVKGLESRMRGYDTEMAYAEHPYLIVRDGFIEVDLVPAIKVEKGSSIVTAVDRTPFHTRFVNSNLTEEQKDDVRVLKQFMKGIGVYGAEIKVMGFSGYICELLVIKYGSFEEVLRQASLWKSQVKIEIVKGEKGFDDPLVIIDPVDPKRNAAAAVSMKSLGTFSLASRTFLKKPSLEYFFPDEVEGKPLGDVLMVEIDVKEKVSSDILWGQVSKSVDRIKKDLSTNGFRVIDVQAWEEGQKVVVGVQLQERIIGEFYAQPGPFFYMNGVEDFVKENENVWIGEEGRLYAIKRRKFTSPEDVIARSITIKVKHEVSMRWEKEGKRGKAGAFMRKTPPWLK
ncbi:CCA tRNA nucleotidyltransferase [Sulfuracidifex tepidarius]|uniref:CCA-adding enzyme n=1 Tax=Sulfuracidifex tepidarius TaxID=1294262 RepID=A0A510E1I8_9CREN|nr:CCA tRNA nucleotidyltransferase [Sulfuracidifex tepidarius]BBG23580.1 CCA-adding enzyme [Sulfuracidifex tepidarius]BBG26327.1 CCA-adding enzyme [Sulfuracidifex tepidarius]